MAKGFGSFIFSGLLILTTALSAETGPVAWKFKTGGSVYATPIIRDGVVYIGSLDSVFYAIEARTGLELWRYQSSNQIFSTAAVEGDLVCFESNNVLFGLDLKGALKWQTPLCSCPVVNRHDEWDDFHSSPVIVDTVAYVGSERGRVVGIDIRSGAVVFECSATGRSTIETPPTVYGGRIYFGDWDGVLYAYDLATASKAWEYDTRKDNTYSWVNAIFNRPLIWNGSLYFAGRSCNLYCLDPETGAGKWMYHDPGSMWLLGGPVISDGTLYIGSSNQYVIHAFDPITGSLKWRQPVDYRIYGNPLVDGDALFFGTGNEINQPLGSLYAADRLTGALINRLPLGGQVHSSPVIEDGILYVGSGDGCVVALDRDGFLNHLLPMTGFKDRNKINWGNIPADRQDFEAGVTVYNTGDGSDSVTVTFIRPFALTADGVMSVEPARFTLAPGDSQVLSIRIDPSRIKPNKYSIAVQAASEYNLEQRSSTKPVVFTVEAVSLVENGLAGSPVSFSLSPNYPNPFNPETTLDYSLPGTCSVRLEIFDMTARKIRTLVDAVSKSGRHSVEWNGLDDLGRPSGTGAYLCRLTMASNSRSQTLVRKILLMK